MTVGADYAGRVGRLRSVMMSSGIDAVVLSLGADLPYFTGYEAMPLERLTALVVALEDPPVLVVPELEAPRVEPGAFEIEPWGELEDPIDIVAGLLDGAAFVAVGDQMWSVFLLRLQDAVEAAWQPASRLTSKLRARKDAAEIDRLRAAAAAVDRVLARIPAEIRFEGRRERDIARDVIDMTVEEGHDTALFWIVASGPNGASPHHEPGNRIVDEGDLVVVDFGGRKDLYCSDVTRTFVVGSPSAEQAEVHGIVLQASRAAREAVRTGVVAQEVDRAARRVIEEAGYGEFFIHRTGHGIGMEGHEHPYIVEGNEQVLEKGMAFSVEPGIYLPGRFGVRIEDIVVVDDGGADELNRAERGLVSVS